MENMNASEVSQVEPTYEIVRPQTAKEKFDMEDNNCYSSFKVAPKVVPQRTEAVYMTKKKYFTGLAVAVVLVAILILAVAACCIVFALEMTQPKLEAVSAEQEQRLSTTADSFNSSLDMIFQQLHILNTSISMQTACKPCKSYKISIVN